jgi:hypothetical protein
MKNKKPWFFEKIKISWEIMVETIKSIKKYPILLLPIFITWIVFAWLVIYLTYYFKFPNNEALQWVIIIGLFWFITFVLTYTSAIMVNLVKQIETDWKTSFKKAFSQVNKKLLSLLWLSFIWAIVWLIITIIDVILSKARENNSSSREISYEWIAKTLWWEWSIFSWLSLWLDVLKDLLRLAVFLSIPAILWKNKDSLWAIKEWWKIIWRHPVEFLWIYGSMVLIIFFMVLPIAIIFVLSNQWVTFPDYVWMLVIIYEWIVWTFNIYMEQMSATLLYLRDMKWQKANEKIENEAEKIPFDKIKKPSLTDDILEFAN